MPVVLRVDGFQVMIFLPPREHSPAHVHVVRDEAEVIINLNTSEIGVSVREIHGMREAHVQRAVAIVARHAALLRQQWRKYHGERANPE